MAERMFIPELRKDEKWKPLFDAATAGLRATEGGGQERDSNATRAYLQDLG